MAYPGTDKRWALAHECRKSIEVLAECLLVDQPEVVTVLYRRLAESMLDWSDNQVRELGEKYIPKLPSPITANRNDAIPGNMSMMSLPNIPCGDRSAHRPHAAYGAWCSGHPFDST